MFINQREKSEILSLLASQKANLRFINNVEEKISLTHPEFSFISSEIKRLEIGFELNYFNTSTNKIIVVKPKDFNTLKHHLSNWVKLINRDYPKILDRKENIIRLSKNYYLILEEAIIIRNLGFEESSGMILRKSLEILIKDYFLFILPQFGEDILTKTVGRLIRYFYTIVAGDFIVKKKEEFEAINHELQDISSLCKKIDATFQIGNDFAHYERRLENITSEDLHSNILKIEKFIDFQIQEECLKDMRGFLKQEFDSDENIK